MAWRDSRRNRARLLLFTSSIILGIAALVAISAFGHNLQKEMDDQAKSLLAADLSIRGQYAPKGDIEALMDSLGGERAFETGFASMVYFPKSGGTRMARIRAIEGNYPFYGTLKTDPPQAAQGFRTAQQALIDHTLMIQYNVGVGDSVKIGEVMFEIAGKLEGVPGQSGVAGTAAPPVFIPQSYVPATQLIQPGSRVSHNYYFKFEEGRDMEALRETIKHRMEEANLRFETVDSRRRRIGRALGRLTDFLNLVAFIALLLGCVGVASAVHVYIKEKLRSVAVLRCLGATGRQAFTIFLIQVMVMGVIGSVIGALFGTAFQVYLPTLLQDFLPMSVTMEVSWTAIGQGILTGIGISLLFALLPLLDILKVSPLMSLRASFESATTQRHPLSRVVYVLIVLFIWGFSYMQTRHVISALVFTIGLGMAFGVLVGIGRFVMWAVRRWFPTGWSYLWRQSLANLYRPNNQTLILLVTIGLGTALIATLYFIQSLLLNQVDISISGNQPNMVLFDIQNEQKDQLDAFIREADLPILESVPIVTMKLDAINGRSRLELVRDTTLDIPRFALNREYRVTYRDSLLGSETVIAGRYVGRVSQGDTLLISMERDWAEELGVTVGDAIDFNVQGVVMPTVLGSIREIDRTRLEIRAFTVLFPSGILEAAPQFHALVTRTPNPDVSATFQQKLVLAYPNVSVVDLNLVLQTVDDLLGKVSFVIQFMALFSILTGLLVLIGSVMLSRYQRVRESILLRTLGANRRQIILINLLEYLLLGSLAALCGIALALASSWALATFTFQLDFYPSLAPIGGVFLLITSLTVLIGLLNSRGILNRPPLEVLRDTEAG